METKRAALAALLALATVMPPVTALEPDTLSPLGRYISVETHRLHYYCVGDAAPTVVIDGGIGGSSIEWRSIQMALSAQARICAYDRAGYGWSDPGPAPRTTARTVAELRQLLRSAGIAPPYILVGHSFGGFTARYFAARYPAEVEGVLLIESSHPRAGIPRARPAGNARNPFPQERDPREAVLNADFEAGHYLNSRRKAVFAQMDEIASFDTSARQVTEAGDLRDIPLRVLARDPALGFPDSRQEDRWQAQQRALARLTPHGHFATAPGSGHEVHGARPDLVIAEISALLAEVRAGGAAGNP